MKCPKCGYNSFDHLDSCKKCGKDLIEHKQRFGIVSVLFPGQMKPVDEAAVAEEAEEESATVEAVVAAATATMVASSEAAEAPAEPISESSSEGDDFGFDFMGESEEEEDLSFDELFEEASADEDVDESLTAPEEEPAAAEDGGAGEFSFDLDDDEPADEAAAAISDLDDDFGFDPTGEEKEATEVAGGPADDLDADAFELPPAKDEGFSFDSDTVEFEDDEDTGTGGDPKAPFDLPESSHLEGAPEQKLDLFVVETVADSADVEEVDLQLDEPLAEPPLDEEVALPGVVVDASNEPAGEFVAPHGELLSEVPAAEPFLAEPCAAEAEELPSPAAAWQEVLEDKSTVEAELPLAAVIEKAPLETTALPAALTEEIGRAAAVAIIADNQLVADVPADIPITEPPVEELAAADLLDEPLSEVLAFEGLPDEAPSVAEADSLPATGSRVAAFCCDLLLLVVVGVSFVVAAEAAIAPSGDNWLPSMETMIDLSVPYFLVLFSLAFGYFTLFHFLAGQTPGKMLTGLRVETIDGEPLLFSQAFLRSVGGLLQMLPGGLGYLVVLSSPDRRGWNDRLAGTRLVSLKGSPVEA